MVSIFSFDHQINLGEASTSAPEQNDAASTASGPIRKRKKTQDVSPLGNITSINTTDTAASDLSLPDKSIKIEAKRIIIGTLHCKPTSYISVHKDGILLVVECKSLFRPCHATNNTIISVI